MEIPMLWAVVLCGLVLGRVALVVKDLLRKEEPIDAVAGPDLDAIATESPAVKRKRALADLEVAKFQLLSVQGTLDTARRGWLGRFFGIGIQQRNWLLLDAAGELMAAQQTLLGVTARMPELDVDPRKLELDLQDPVDAMKRSNVVVWLGLRFGPATIRELVSWFTGAKRQLLARRAVATMLEQVSTVVDANKPAEPVRKRGSLASRAPSASEVRASA
jgi:hypothetical protein